MTIEVSDETYEFLKECKHLLQTQDNRCTRDVMYTVMKKDRIYGIDPEYSCDEYEYIHDGEKIGDNSKEIIERLFELNFYSTIKNIVVDSVWFDEIDTEVLNSEEKLCDYLTKELEESEYKFDDLFSELNISKVYYHITNELSQSDNIFSLFEADAKEYILSNYDEDSSKNEKWTYGESCWRAKRMSKLIEVLKGIV
jgi:hypothetical protein